MGKGRYIIAIVVAVAVFILGIVLACTVLDPNGEAIEGRVWFCILFYGIGAFLANLIWFDGPVITVGLFGVKICGVILSFLLGLLGSLIGWILLLFLFPILFTGFVVVAAITLCATFLVAAIMFPINIFRFSRDLY